MSDQSLGILRQIEDLNEYVLSKMRGKILGYNTLAWATKRLRQYMLTYTMWLIARMDPLKYVFENSSLTGRIAQ